jgi:hypothetical protein
VTPTLFEPVYVLRPPEQQHEFVHPPTFHRASGTGPTPARAPSVTLWGYCPSGAIAYTGSMIIIPHVRGHL